MKTTNNSLKKTVYDYDLQSGKVDKVTYQHGYPDAFYHIYQYDAENRLTNVQTSADSVNWDNDAYYSYYLHGPLSRTILGDQQVQGINYAYTLQGWMKEVNPPIYSGTGYVLQPDGSSGSEVASNAYNLLLNYYDQDYAAVSPITSADNGVNTTLGTGYRPLYNGNISSIGANIGALGHPLLYNYQYDQLNRLVHMDAWNNTGSTWSSSTILPDFQENVAYDPNGNILQYKRNGNNTFAGSNINMDSLNYAYTYGTNKLDHISDNVASGNYPNDIDNQSIGNYTYDAIGELTADNASGITGITWTVYGKINTITKSGSTIAFTYDPAGNRISKTVTASGNTITTWYVRDAQGNVMSIYTAGDPTINSGDLTQTEVDMYGSSRLGLTKCNIDLQTFVAATQTSFPLLGWGTGLIFTRGNKLFELSNHLGNVLATISDKKIGVSLDGTTVDHFNPLVLDANDYYPFGSLEPGRTYAATSAGNYRYGFNGKENDNEVKGLGDQIDYGKRIYDPRVGRFLSLDPYYKKYPELTPYQFASNTPLQAVDLDGLEKYIIHYRPHDGKDNIVKVVTNNSIIYTSISIEEEPVLPAVVQFVKEDKNGNVISRTGEIPLKNYGSTLYVGPDNPKYESGPKKGTDRYDLPAINSLDAAAKKHDLAYDKERVAGITGALFSLSVLPADKQLIKDAQAVIDLYNKNQKDPVNKQPVSTLTVNAAKNVVASFTKIVAEKEAQISILNATNEIKTNAQTIVEAIKAALTVPIH